MTDSLPYRRWIPRWIRRRIYQRHCLHGYPKGASYVSQELFDLGRGKMFVCSDCKKIWIV